MSESLERRTRTDATARFRLDDRVAIVTGASSGLGVAFARGLAEAGARVVLVARRAERLAAVAEQIRCAGGESVVVAADVAREEDVERMVAQTLDRLGRIDVLVNNAAQSVIRRAEEETLDEFRGTLEVGLTGAFLCAQRCGRAMLAAGRGTIVNIASILGLVGSGQIPQASYCAAKGGLVNLTRELALQWARRGVRVNAIAPGFFPSEMTASMFDDERSMKWLRGRTPMGRAGVPDELIGALLFLASDASSYVTGQVIAVDGGWTSV